MRVDLLPTEGGGTYRFVIILLAICGILISSLPVIVVTIMSFSAAENTGFPPEALSLRWYSEVIEMFTAQDANSAQSVVDSTLTSLLVALIVMVISTGVCIPLAYVLARGDRRIRGGMELLFTLPLVFPLVILGIAFLLIAESLRLDIGIWRIIIPHVALVLPFVLRNCLSAMSGISIEVEEAAVSLGASPLRAIWDVVIPMMKAGILAGLIFALIISFNEFTITFFMYTVDVSTLPIWMYSRTVSSLDPSTLALSVFIIVADVLLIVLVDKLIAGRASLF
ncbi:ABC transporter permease [Sulfitobacter geojensis]|uniref:ABC transporter permease n=1 Tax=Sulfitobacter geojensis TaxID=1342299 RepID=A0AAE3B6I1_9RHOB|nr:ABC transporter permease [Sulfitobacter geojensis]MBM1689971.1 ABC transporter permease [Sulfitobacter geojensis]MBM1694037.1 ABC transporter permease [Sulfitobacter geojensis]MBM1706203.1 ABC transporter permease [Sulfitobacter geojensis]MBM1710261.1 ABC transporter permease [Sulfitobacter geojensis]MBM1714327.1 ABC transporter permease [Sulfitobacter geojensis]